MASLSTECRTPHLRVAALAALVAVLPHSVRPLAAQAPSRPSIVSQDSVMIVPDSTFAAGGLHRWLFGTHWRGAWRVPVRIPVLALGAIDGGLVPVQRGGGKQTQSLRLRAASGREYVFRSLRKDPSPLVPPELRGTFISDVLADQISASHPYAPLVVDRLLDAVGVPHASPVLAQLPSSGLGSFTAEFGGLVGFLELRATDDDAARFGAEEIEGTFDLLEKLDGDERHRVDARAYLSARLMDLWLGDWDRHADQWRWARRDSAGLRVWQAIPRDRDQAFSRYDGLLLGLARQVAPQLTVFGPDRGSALGLGWNARFLDRRLLGGLAPSAWDSTARALAARLTDAVIDSALARLPADPAAGASALRAALQVRRAGLPAAAEALRRLHAREAELYGTGGSDTLQVQREGDRLRAVLISARGDTLARREYAAGETAELRVYLGAGDDRVVVTGRGSAPMLRLITERGSDRIEAEQTRGLRAYDSDTVAASDGVGVQRRPATRSNSWAEAGGAVPPRDWGAQATGLPFVSAGPDLGLVIGTGIGRTTFGFRRAPAAVRVDARIGVATGAAAPIAALRIRWQHEQRTRATELQLLGSGAEQLQWYGAGNETLRDSVPRFYRARTITLRGRLLQSVAVGARGTFSIGPEVRWTRTARSTDRLLGVEQPYGFGDFGRVALLADLTVDTRDAPSGASRGILLQLGGSAAPELWDAASAYGELHGEVRTYLTPGRANAPTLALRAGGRAVIGTAPYLDRALIGGASTVRGLREQRFAGRQSAYGSAELRQALGRVKVVVPLRVGLFGFGDAGRVFETGESSDRWHWGAGGGLWAAIFQTGSTLSIGAARSDDRTTGIYLRAGMAF